MALTQEQRDFCAAFGLPERLVEDATTVSESCCQTCLQPRCVCLTEFPFGIDEEADTDPKKKLELAKKAREIVAKDVRASWNEKKDDVTFYPATETPLKN